MNVTIIVRCQIKSGRKNVSVDTLKEDCRKAIAEFVFPEPGQPEHISTAMGSTVHILAVEAAQRG